ncbi:MAG: response regulator [Anaerolineae bacterium]|nr:response regulator [Anaerolineae bacterium]
MANELILIVDDSPEIFRIMDRHILTPLGYQLLHATDGRDGLQQAVEQQPDLILLDLNMPEMSGMEMLAELRETDCTCPVIFMTMHGSESVAVEAFRLGVSNYLIKPFTSEEVIEAIDSALLTTRLSQEKEELTRSMIATEVVHETTVTLAHYINNYLMTVVNGLSLLEENLSKQPFNAELLDLVQHSHDSAKKIGAVLRVLQRVTKVQEGTYVGEVKMIDVEAALQEELEQQQ